MDSLLHGGLFPVYFSHHQFAFRHHIVSGSLYHRGFYGLYFYLDGFVALFGYKSVSYVEQLSAKTVTAQVIGRKITKIFLFQAKQARRIML